MASPHWLFGPFRLDPANACLWRGPEAMALPPKVFAVLHYLVTHPDHLVTKDELLDAVWPETGVTDAVVRVAIGALRKALHDTAPPRFIATVPRRGYRFVAPVAVADTPQEPPSSPTSQALRTRSLSPPLVERDAVLQRLAVAWAGAPGRRQVVLVTGEAGIGKTAVVDAFGRRWRRNRRCGWPGPVHGAVRGGGSVPARAGRVRAALPWPGWGAPGDAAAAARPHLAGADALAPHARGPEQLRAELQGTTRERMLRERAEVVDTLTAETPLVLLFEDLHWSDYATLDLLALLARRRDPAQLLLIGTYRPVETIAHRHPMWHGGAGLAAARTRDRSPPGVVKRACGGNVSARALSPPALADGARAVAAPADRRASVVSGHPGPGARGAGCVHEHDGCWTAHGDIEALALEVPESLRQLLAQR